MAYLQDHGALDDSCNWCSRRTECAPHIIDIRDIATGELNVGSHFFEMVDGTLRCWVVVSTSRDDDQILGSVAREVKCKTATEPLEAADDQV